MKKQDRDEMYRRIIEHGNNLLAIFPNAAIQEPVLLCRLLGITEEDVMFINRDPRGYALKLTEEFSKDKRIYKDWGGYGIIAPDFTPNE